MLDKSWRNNDLIDESTYKHLNITNGNLSRYYGLPKIRKTGFPLRIIASLLSSPLYNVSKYIHIILYNSNLQPKSHMKDDWSFVANMKDKLINDEIMISLDVTALFTNIPKDFYIKIILDSTSFSFIGQFYEQIFGTEIVMVDLETHCLNLLSFTVPLYYRYVDDIFAIVPHTKIDEIRMIFDSYHQRLKFTHEIESDSFINFLNTTVIRSNGRILTNWYKNPTCSNKYVNFYSNDSFKYKMDTIFSLIGHAILLSDDQSDFSSDIFIKILMS
ncbi:hypothetical protein ACFW04_014140 [Cataglyphis niger]